MSEASPTELYVYGVVAADTPPPEGAGVGALAAPLRTVANGDLAALVSDVPAGPLEAARGDLQRHGEVLREAMDVGTVLPMRFGMVMPGEDAVREELLERHRPRLTELLEHLRGRVELTLRATYEEEPLLREVIGRRPEAARLVQRVRGSDEAATYHERIRLGELIVEEIEQLREQDTAAMLERLGSLAEDVHVGSPPHERTAYAVSFLVEADAVERFDEAARELAAGQEGRLRFSYVGPLPPHSFVRFEEQPAWG
jgi:hypothetical protein